MGVAKLNIGGNPFIGAFGIATESFAIIGNTATQAERRLLSENMGVDLVTTSVDGSDLIGIYSVANAGCVLMPNLVRDLELGNIRKALPGKRIERFQSDLNALGNNILANDKVAIVNPDYSADEAKAIGELLDVEVVRLAIGGLVTVGANNVLTNKGIVMNNRASEADMEMLKELVGEISQTTANLGSLSVGLSVIANSKGILVGAETSGFELARIAEGLGL